MMLESRQVTKRFGSKIAVDGISVKMEAGHIYAMLGPNGSGKTTWMKLAAGLLLPDGGEMLYNGQPVGVQSRAEVAYMSTEPYFYTWMNIKDVGAYYADFFQDFKKDRYRVLLDRMELTEKMKTKNLSSGMMAKLKIAVTLSRAAKVFMLDEPFNGIDILARDEILKSILEATTEDTIMIMSSHLVEEMESIADQVIYIREGKLVEASDVEMLREKTGHSMSEHYRAIYGRKEENA